MRKMFRSVMSTGLLGGLVSVLYYVTNDFINEDKQVYEARVLAHDEMLALCLSRYQASRSFYMSCNNSEYTDEDRLRSRDRYLASVEEWNLKFRIVAANARRVFGPEAEKRMWSVHDKFKIIHEKALFGLVGSPTLIDHSIFHLNLKSLTKSSGNPDGLNANQYLERLSKEIGDLSSLLQDEIQGRRFALVEG